MYCLMWSLNTGLTVRRDQKEDGTKGPVHFCAPAKKLYCNLGHKNLT